MAVAEVEVGGHGDGELDRNAADLSKRDLDETRRLSMHGSDANLPPLEDLESEGARLAKAVGVHEELYRLLKRLRAAHH